jgi:wobble nucleotide-excising tRNase
MNTTPKPKFSISARYLGPIFSLDCDLTKKPQNLIFARNGTGKSFLSRGFRCLDHYFQNKDISDAAFSLVSDEAADGKGSFLFSRGAHNLGTLTLVKQGDVAKAVVNDTIFHVFSEDFVHEELRERQYALDGDIKHQIAVDSENIKVQDARAALGKAQAEETTALESLRTQFATEKSKNLNEKAAVNRQLKEYNSSTIDKILSIYSEKPHTPDQSFQEILKDLDNLKSIPADPSYPDTIKMLESETVDLGALATSLEKITSPSSVSEKIKKKIETHHTFYEEGIKIVRDQHQSECPFCEQNITDINARTVIDAYIAYFSDEEEKHKSELRAHFRGLMQTEKAIDHTESQLARQKSRFDDLKVYVPSRKNDKIPDHEMALTSSRNTLSNIKSKIEQKSGDLRNVYSLDTTVLQNCIRTINRIIEDCNEIVRTLNNAVKRADEERKDLQRKACVVFEQEFAIAHWVEIERLRELQGTVKTRSEELSALEKASPSMKARDRVAETFELLLRDFFSDKYIFDKEAFALKRGDREMTRGPHRTLSDGEKTAIAFCYFIACVHRKVDSSSEYRKLFLVFDDPVTSMSYDFVFSIAQTLKNLSVSNKGDVSINPGLIDGNKRHRPDLLVLTHSSYFFNILITNRVIEDSSAFALYTDGNIHKLAQLSKYIAPFQEQLMNIYDVANGKEPDHTTANSVRSVLEAIGRFCRPDKSDSLTNFVQYLAGEEGINIKSVLINSLCHGTYYDETPPPDDLALACEETLTVVNRFAVGQIELIKRANGN